MLVFKNRKERRDWIRKMNPGLFREWDKHREQSSLMQEFTPAALMTEMLEKIPSFENKEILVLGNVEFYFYLKNLENQGKISYKSLTLLTDMKELENKPNVIYIPFEDMNKVSISKKFDIVIGNPPYQLNTSDSSNTTALYDKFYYIAKEVSKQYISFVIPYEWTKRNNSKFKKEMFDSGVLSKLNVHTRQEFKGIQKVTCDFLVDLKKTSKEVEVSTNKGLDNTLTLSSESLLLNNLTLLEKPSTGLDLLWKRGTTSISELSEKGKYPVVYSLGGKKPIKILYSDTETTGLGKWKVAVSNLGGIGNIGAVKILPPEYAHNYSIVSFAVGSESEAVDLQKYLTSENIRELVQNAKGSTPNSKSIFSYIEYDRTTS
jgi:hypothetical protein